MISGRLPGGGQTPRLPEEFYMSSAPLKSADKLSTANPHARTFYDQRDSVPDHLDRVDRVSMPHMQDLFLPIEQLARKVHATRSASCRPSTRDLADSVGAGLLPRRKLPRPSALRRCRRSAPRSPSEFIRPCLLAVHASGTEFSTAVAGQHRRPNPGILLTSPAQDHYPDASSFDC